MKKKFLAAMGLLLLTALVLTACASKGTTPSGTNSAPAQDQAAASGTTNSGNTDVKALILEKLQNHHGSDIIFNANKTRAEWEVTLDRMIGYGAKINEEEKQLIIDYLVNQ